MEEKPPESDVMPDDALITPEKRARSSIAQMADQFYRKRKRASGRHFRPQSVEGIGLHRVPRRRPRVRRGQGKRQSPVAQTAFTNGPNHAANDHVRESERLCERPKVASIWLPSDASLYIPLCFTYL